VETANGVDSDVQISRIPHEAGSGGDCQQSWSTPLWEVGEVRGEAGTVRKIDPTGH
jgi:hypothetical protein